MNANRNVGEGIRAGKGNRTIWFNKGALHGASFVVHVRKVYAVPY
jgi:hypothetical protein